MTIRTCHWFLLVVVVEAAALYADDQIAFFESRIRPVLVKHCYECHSPMAAKVKGGLRLDYRDGVREGGESGEVISVDDPASSLLIKALRHQSPKMPPKQQLPESVVRDFEQWIANGAVDPRDRPLSQAQISESAWKAKLADRRTWWSLLPRMEVAPPEGDAEDPVDRWIDDRLHQVDLSRAEPAGGMVLLRRASFVLTGLPPTANQVRAFESAWRADPDQAYESLIDSLLASPHYGERIARHWMDAIRYTDTFGYEWDNRIRGSWEFRDYLIRAFNKDVGFDQMVREHIAGDLLKQPRIDEDAGVNESVIAPAFYHLGEHRHGSSLDFNGIHQDMVDNKIDAFSKAFLGMTAACARCHNHKLDAISQRDYYALAGVFMSPRWCVRVIDAAGKHDRQIEQLKALRSKIQSGIATAWQQSVNGEQWADQLRHSLDDKAVKAKESAPAEALHHIRKIHESTDETIRETWDDLKSAWSTEHAKRLKAVANVDAFSGPDLPDGWAMEGDSMHHGYVESGTVHVALEGDRLITTLLPCGYHTHALSSKLPGAIRLPDQAALPGTKVRVKLTGGGWAGYITIPQNAFQSEKVKFLDPKAAAGWIAITDQGLKNGVTRVSAEIVTAPMNPNFPARRDLNKMGGKLLPEKDDGIEQRSWFSLTGIVMSDQAATPDDTLDVFTSLYERPAPTTAKQATAMVVDWLRGIVTRWSTGESAKDELQVINMLVQAGMLPNTPDLIPAVASLVTQYREIESTIAFPRTAMSMAEDSLDPLDYRLNVRGNVDQDGPAVPRGYLGVYDGHHAIDSSPGSGRLELAEYLSRADHPQTARVYVNRIWQWVFGTGIVATSNDFGKLGDRPSHPELLDMLANDFVANGWSTKKLIRRLMLTSTFRQSGVAIANATDVDPANRLLHHYPTRRLEAEAIRDSLLAVSGRMDRTLYGPPIDPYRKAEDLYKRLFSGPLDGDGRRSIYLEMSIMDPPGFLVGFNLPKPRLPTGRRDVTNVPTQSLTLLNDPFVVQMAKHWATHIQADGSDSVDARVTDMFVTALGRRPTAIERRRWSQAVNSFSDGGQDVMSDSAAWAELAHALFNVKEFIYYR